MNPQERKKKTSKEVLLKLWPYLVATFLFAAISFWFFSWGQDIHLAKKGYVIDNELFGTYGDFFGGVLGTIFSLCSVILLIKTFQHQRVVTKRSADQMDLQRFHDLFFELLRLYQSQVAELCSVEDFPKEQKVVHYSNKDFFDYEKRRVQESFVIQKSFEKNQLYAVNIYMQFYIKNKTKLGAYYRTLYRIYDLIDNSQLSEPIKRDYLKIMRAQLTESELFFLRYNALTFYGCRFVEYMNRYHIMKHLPAFELLEFKDWWSNLSPNNKTKMNIVFSSLSSVIRLGIKEGSIDKNVPPSNEKGKYVLRVKTVNSSDCLVEMRIYDKRDSGNSRDSELSVFDEFNEKKIQRLLDCFIKEIFVYSNFDCFNKNIAPYSSPIVHYQDGCKIINSGIRNILNQPLIIAGPSSQSSQNSLTVKRRKP